MTQADQNTAHVPAVREPTQQVPEYQPVYQPAAPVPLTAPVVNVMPHKPLGDPRGSIDGTLLAQLSAQMTAMGAQEGAVSEYFTDIQAIAINTALAASHKLLRDHQKISARNINRAIQEVRALQPVQVPVSQPSLTGRLFGTAPMVVQNYVSLDSVLQILISAMDRTAPAA